MRPTGHGQIFYLVYRFFMNSGYLHQVFMGLLQIGPAGRKGSMRTDGEVLEI